MRVDIWSDVVCPWCYIGKRRLEAALAEFEHRDEVEVVWHSYQLDPTAANEPRMTASESLATKFPGGPAQVEEALARVAAMAREEGLEFGPDSWSANTIDAHRLLHLALEEGGPQVQGRMKEALLHANFVENRHVGDHDVLVDAAAVAGLDAEKVSAVLSSNAFAREVAADIAQARAFGATGVPFFVIDNKYGISGAQPKEAFAQVLERAWDEARPQVQLIDAGAADAENCGPDGCAI